MLECDELNNSVSVDAALVAVNLKLQVTTDKTSYTDADIQAATEAYALLAKFGGADLTGDKPDLAAGTFWAGYRK